MSYGLKLMRRYVYSSRDDHELEGVEFEKNLTKCTNNIMVLTFVMTFFFGHDFTEILF